MKNTYLGITIGVFIAGIRIGYGLIPQTPKQDTTVEANLARFDELDYLASKIGNSLIRYMAPRF